MFRAPTASGGGGGVPLTSITTQSPNPTDMGDQSHHRAAAARAFQFHPARPAIIDLFNLYLGRSGREKSDDLVREPPNKTQKRVTALNRDLPPRNEQFLLDFEQLQNQFPDREQLRTVSESVLISLVIQCSNHAPRAEFILFALRNLYTIGYINWDTFLPSLLSAVSSAEMSVSVSSTASPPPPITSTSLSQTGMLPSTTIPNSSNFQSSSPASPLISVHGIGSPSQSANEPSTTAISPVKSSDMNNGQMSRSNVLTRDNAISSLRQLCCKIIFSALEASLKPCTHADIFNHMMNWLVNWDQQQQGSDDVDGIKSWKRDKALFEWLHNCLDVIWLFG